MTEWTRRRFLQAAGAGAAVAATGVACSSSDSKGSGQTDTSGSGQAATAGLAKFDHLVVLMFENRSFDNLLGHLYEPGKVPRGQAFDGVIGKDLSNPIPSYALDADRKVVPLQLGDVMDDPNPDPGEDFPHINTQMFGTVLPAGNQFLDVGSMAAPFNRPPAGTKPDMSGFVTDYINNFRVTEGRLPNFDEYRVIMNCFAPESVPVLSTLAKQFAVFDNWHCEVPSQTFCNRSFFHAASSSGLVINSPYLDWLSQNKAETVFNRMTDKGAAWKVYFDHSQKVSLTGLIHAPTTRDHWKSNFVGMDEFFADVERGQLPAYSFIEPRMLFDHNDMHPPASLVDVDGVNITPASNVLAGEALLAKVYDAIRSSAAQKGSNWRNTALLITFDEAGGTYDHVVPPSAPIPVPSAGPGQEGWTFDQLGIRVPAILVSAHTEAGTVINTPMRHTSTIASLRERFGLGGPLTQRDADAGLLGDAFNRDKPRSPGDWPKVTPRPVPAASYRNGLSEQELNLPLPGLARNIYGLALGAIRPGVEPDLPAQVTVGKALDDLGAQLGPAFG